MSQTINWALTTVSAGIVAGGILITIFAFLGPGYIKAEHRRSQAAPDRLLAKQKRSKDFLNYPRLRHYEAIRVFTENQTGC